jgi:hypothetical protein
MQKPDYLGLALGIGSAVGGGLMKGNANAAPKGWTGQSGAPTAGNFRTDLKIPGINYGGGSNLKFPSGDGWTNGFNFNSRNYLQ